MARLNSDGSLDYSQDPYAAPSPPLPRQRYDAQGNPIPDGQVQALGDRESPTPSTPAPAPSAPTPAPAPSAPAAPATPAASAQPRYNTTPDWQDPLNPPSKGDPYWDAWIAANPTYGQSTTPAATKPTGGNTKDPTYALSLVNYWASQPGANPSLKNDPQYWVRQMGAANNDQGYWEGRFMQPEGPPEGAQSSTSTTTPSGAPGDNSQLSDFLSKLLAGQSSYNSTTTSQRQSILDRIKSLADTYAKPVTADDPNIKAQTDAFHGTTARSLQDYRAMAAERANAEGVPSGAFDSQVGNAANQAGQAEAGFQGNLMQTQMMSNRQALSDMLRQGAGALSSQDQADIQNKMAAIDAALGNQGQQNTLSLGTQSLSLQKLLGLLGLGNQSTSINNQNNQFYDQFAYNQANNGQNQNDLLLQWLLQNG